MQDRFAVDDPGRIRQALAGPDASRPGLVAVSGTVVRVEPQDDTVEFDLRLELGDASAGAMPLAVRFDRPGTTIPLAREAHVLGYVQGSGEPASTGTPAANAPVELAAIGVYFPHSTHGYYLREHQKDYVAWSSGKRSDEVGKKEEQTQ